MVSGNALGEKMLRLCASLTALNDLQELLLATNNLTDDIALQVVDSLLANKSSAIKKLWIQAIKLSAETKERLERSTKEIQSINRVEQIGGASCRERVCKYW